MRRWSFALLVLICLGQPIFSGLADSLIPLGPRIYADGRYAMKIVPDRTNDVRNPATGELFTLNPDGSNRVMWRGKLVNLPSKVIIGSTERGHGPFVATIDSYYDRGADHAVVIYVGLAGNMSLDDGSLCWDCPLTFLLPASEIARMRHSASGIWWADHAKFAFEGNAFVIRMDSGLVVRLDLMRGTMSRSDGTPPRDMPTGALRRPREPWKPPGHKP